MLFTHISCHQHISGARRTPHQTCFHGKQTKNKHIQCDGRFGRRKTDSHRCLYSCQGGCWNNQSSTRDGMFKNRGTRLYISVEHIIQPPPLWVVKPEATQQSSNYYSTMNARIYRSPQLPMANRYHNNDLDAKYGMSVEVAYPIRKVCCCQSLSEYGGLIPQSYPYFSMLRRSHFSTGIRYTAGLPLNQRRDVAVSSWWPL